MRRMALVGVLVAVGVVGVRARGAKLQERLMAHCEAMFDRMPETFPPKKMMRGIEDIRADTNRILELLEADQDQADTAQDPEAASREAVHHAA